MSSFAQVVDAADKLSLDEQQALVEILHRRIADQNRQQLVADVAEAEAEYAAGRCHPTSVEELMREIQS